VSLVVSVIVIVILKIRSRRDVTPEAF